MLFPPLFKTISFAPTSPLALFSSSLAEMTNSKASNVLSRLSENDVPWGSVFCDKMLVMEWSRHCGWGEPQLKPFGPISLSPSASIFHYGMEVFEGTKAFRASANREISLFRPELNIARLNHSAKRLALPTVDEGRMLELLKAFVDCQRDWVPSAEEGALYIRPSMIATDITLGVKRSDTAMLFIIASPVKSFFGGNGRGLLKGVKLLANPKYVRAWQGGVGYCKTGGNYACSIAPTEEARELGFDQILWLSDEHRKLVTEVGMMNVFFVIREKEQIKLVTPRLDGTILDGVTRRSVLELAHKMGLDVEERDISLDEVFEGVERGKIVEIFGTGTAALVCPVQSVTAGERIAALKVKEEKGDFSVLLREKLVEIQNSSDRHPWMVRVHRGDEMRFLNVESNGFATNSTEKMGSTRVSATPVSSEG